MLLLCLKSNACKYFESAQYDKSNTNIVRNVSLSGVEDFRGCQSEALEDYFKYGAITFVQRR